jgi:tRNA-splicing endonuclease subunit Sen2
LTRRFRKSTCAKVPSIHHQSFNHPSPNMTAGPSGSGFSGKPNPRARQQANNAKYGSPLPILLPNSTTGQKGKSKSIFSAYTAVFTTEVGVPKCTGIYDPVTRSVWVMDRGDVDILFRRGFFGKGTLSRSEPSWRERRVELVKGGSCTSLLL